MNYTVKLTKDEGRKASLTPKEKEGVLIAYISGVSNLRLIEVAREHGIGILLTPDTAFAGPKYERIFHHYPMWSADNGCFAHPNRTPSDLLAWLERLPQKDALFFPAPDVVGNAKLTIERSLPVLPQIRKLGFKAAFVAQNGIEETPIPWDEFDCLFIGGDTQFKLSEQSKDLVTEAKSRNKWVHMGRVNSYRRLKLANDWGCDSADGTYLRFTGPPGVERILEWLRKIKGENKCEQSISAVELISCQIVKQKTGERQLNLNWQEAIDS